MTSARDHSSKKAVHQDVQSCLQYVAAHTRRKCACGHKSKSNFSSEHLNKFSGSSSLDTLYSVPRKKVLLK